MSNTIKRLFGFTQAKPKQSVQEILSGFSAQVRELQDLQSKKEAEVISTNEQIADLNQRAVEAREEAEKAQRAAQKIKAFLED